MACTFMLTARVYGCFCFSTPICSQISTRPRFDAAFLGQVVDIWPSGRTLADEYERLSHAQKRRLTLQRWAVVLSPEEKKYVRTTTERDRMEADYAFLPRVRFKVTEVLAGMQIREIYTESTSCGYRFQRGKVYLVILFRDGRRYSTGACSRTGPVESDEAVEDLKVAREYVRLRFGK